jgi:hypothetical protein
MPPGQVYGQMGPPMIYGQAEPPLPFNQSVGQSAGLPMPPQGAPFAMDSQPALVSYGAPTLLSGSVPVAAPVAVAGSVPVAPPAAMAAPSAMSAPQAVAAAPQLSLPVEVAGGIAGMADVQPQLAVPSEAAPAAGVAGVSQVPVEQLVQRIPSTGEPTNSGWPFQILAGILAILAGVGLWLRTFEVRLRR